MIDQTWQYHFCNAVRSARSDRHVQKDKRDPRQQSKNDRIFFAKPAWSAGYAAGYDPTNDKAAPFLLYQRWIETYVPENCVCKESLTEPCPVHGLGVHPGR